MNREILFRGKRKQDGVWAHGDLVRLKDGDKQVPCIYYFGEVYRYCVLFGKYIPFDVHNNIFNPCDECKQAEVEDDTL